MKIYKVYQVEEHEGVCYVDIEPGDISFLSSLLAVALARKFNIIAGMCDHCSNYHVGVTTDPVTMKEIIVAAIGHVSVGSDIISDQN